VRTWSSSSPKVSQQVVRSRSLPVVSPRPSPAVLRELDAHGVRRVSLSLDGGTASAHDTIRQMAGHFDATLNAVRMLDENGFALQMNGDVYPLLQVGMLLETIRPASGWPRRSLVTSQAKCSPSFGLTVGRRKDSRPAGCYVDRLRSAFFSTAA